MPLTFAKKTPGQQAAPQNQAPQAQPQQTAQTQAPQQSGPKLSFMKRGQSAQQAIVTEDAKAEKAKSEKGKLWRFWMPPNSSRKITFLDGALDHEGMLDIPMFYEHEIQVNGDWHQYVCTAEKEGYCPICASALKGSKPALVGVLTILDHTPHTIKSGQNAGKTIVNTRKLYVAKRDLVKTLSKLAGKRGGLIGCTFEVLRGDEKTSKVGGQFDFEQKRTLAELAQALGLKIEDVQPADPENEITYLSVEELVKLGLGKAPSGPGFEKTSTANLKDQL